MRSKAAEASNLLLQCSCVLERLHEDVRCVLLVLVPWKGTPCGCREGNEFDKNVRAQHLDYGLCLWLSCSRSCVEELPRLHGLRGEALEVNGPNI